ncbi:hypothetical protein BJ508DRAFT_181695 [Ascobolus immersus RN42]|uniref:Uncharacterized protein n=1 Tax=Ascobolus immersus RN42 TaxID=1160509 RepID=A0A3N4HSC0_ASCIM|nr:hypothetical protein BJ508DRAFT_181695 [Ascobolus immersus RN42]
MVEVATRLDDTIGAAAGLLISRRVPLGGHCRCWAGCGYLSKPDTCHCFLSLANFSLPSIARSIFFGRFLRPHSPYDIAIFTGCRFPCSAFHSFFDTCITEYRLPSHLPFVIHSQQLLQAFPDPSLNGTPILYSASLHSTCCTPHSRL